MSRRAIAKSVISDTLHCEHPCRPPGPWLVGTTKVYSGVGSLHCYESITLTTGKIMLHAQSGKSTNCDPETLERCRVHSLAPSCAKDGIPAQAGFLLRS